MFTCPDWLESNKWYLHGQQQSNNIEDTVADKQSLGEPAHDEQHKYMQWDQIDDKYVATPC